MRIEAKQDWHHLAGDSAIALLESNLEKGLTTEEAHIRVAKYGPNALAAKKGKSALVRFLLQFHQPLIYILLVAVAVTGWLGEWVDSGVIFAVVFINAVVGFLQESRALKALEALARAMRAEARVIRGGKTREMPAGDLVPGDIVLLQSGEKVPADLLILRSHELRIDESTLTGESVPVHKKESVLAREIPLADRTNMAFASTLVTYGQCKGLVVETGEQTEIGHISKLVSEAADLETPLTRKIGHFSHILLYIILVLAALTFAVGIYQGNPASETFMAAVALAVAAIPEGLPAAFTIILAIGVSRMARKNAIIRKLPAVETLGSTTVICSDKTGTLTVNKMTVQEIVTGNRHYSITGTGYQPKGDILDADTQEKIEPGVALKECLLAGLLCNDSLLVEEEGEWTIEGDPTEGALLVAARKIGLTEEHYCEALPRISAIPFESEYQYMATMHNQGNDLPRRVYVKGAVETLLAKCKDRVTFEGDTAPLDHNQVFQEVAEMAKNGLRVLAFAKKELPAGTTEFGHKEVENGLTFLGIQGMIDPPRQEAIDAIAACHTAGIRVKMITGDHAVTASAIARQMNLDGSNSPQPPAVLTGREMASLSDDALARAVSEIPVFARVSPDQKLRLVCAQQAQGHVIAMTGDGVNDAPALKQADIGIAMGLGGTEVAKEAADMVLTDDNFATIKTAIEEGRCVFDNLTKFIVWTLPTNLGEALVVLSAIFAGLTLPVLPIHILWINMATALFLGLMLAFERKETDIMDRPPRDPAAPILTLTLGARIIVVSLLMTAATFTLFQWEQDQGNNIDAARTVAVNVIVFVEIFYLLNCRSLKRSVFSIGLFSNRWLIYGIVGMILLQLLFTYLPLANRIFHTTPISWDAWLRIIGAGIVVFSVVGLEKWIRQKVHR
ncbi:cation-transporting P-type ATPase [Emcibacter sp.]|uniref:cation-transporting P-type ATPase n=1 Tax=Emcibacter sp. TaxID=1979954 RepID=UPI003A907D83